MCLMRRKTGWRISLYRTQRVWDMVGGGKQIASGEAAGTMTWECWMPGQKVSILGCKVLFFFFPYPHSSHIVLNIEFLSKGLNTLPQTPGIGPRCTHGLWPKRKETGQEPAWVVPWCVSFVQEKWNIDKWTFRTHYRRANPGKKKSYLSNQVKEREPGPRYPLVWRPWWPDFSSLLSPKNVWP